MGYRSWNWDPLLYANSIYCPFFFFLCNFLTLQERENKEEDPSSLWNSSLCRPQCLQLPALNYLVRELTLKKPSFEEMSMVFL